MSDLEALFAKAQSALRETEERLVSLEQLNTHLEASLVELAREQEIPTIWITGPGRSIVKVAVMSDSLSENDGTIPIKLDTKYYTADVLVHVGEVSRLEEHHEAVVLAIDGPFDEELASQVFDSLGEVRICVCDDDRAVPWCIDQGVEIVSWGELSRIKEALESSRWPNMVMKSKPKSEGKPKLFEERAHDTKSHLPENTRANSSEARAERSVEDELAKFEQLMLQAMHIKQSSSSQSDGERRSRAAEAAEAMMKLLGMEDDESDAE